jgi:hypothetical protein
MGHIRLGTLPKSRKWQHVVSLLAEGADAGAIATASSDAAENSLAHAAKDPALAHAFWLLTQAPLAARKENFGAELRRLGLKVGNEPTLMEVVGAFTDAVDRHVRETGRRSDLAKWRKWRPRKRSPP